MSAPPMDEWDIHSPATTLEDLLHSLPDLEVLVDGAGLRQLTRWVHVSELADPTPYLRGHELLLTAGVHLPRSAADTQRYVARLADVGVVGLGFGVDPIYHAVPPRLVAACQTHAMLLLRVPPNVPFIAVSEAHVRLLEESRRRAGQMTARAQRQIVRAAARRRPVQAIVSALGAQLQASIMLTDHRAGTRWSTGRMPPTARKLAQDLIGSPGARQSAAVHEPGLHAYAQIVEVPGRTMTLTISSSQPPAYPTHSLIGIASSVIALTTGHTSTVRLTALGEALARCVTGTDIGTVEPAVIRALDLDIAGDRCWSVVMAAPARAETSQASAASREAAFAEAVQSTLRFADGTLRVAVMADPARARAAVDLLATETYRVGLSDPCTWQDLPQAAREARRRLMVARLEGPTQSGHLPQVYSLVHQEAAEGFAAAHLAPLLERPPAEADRLLATLQGWLECDGNWDRTAEALGIHRNTVRNRMSTIRRLLNRNLRSPEARTSLWLALQWHDLYRSASMMEFQTQT